MSNSYSMNMHNAILMIMSYITECEDAIDMKLNEVYGITSGSVTSANDDINTIPNEVYGVALVSGTGDHSSGVSSCQRWL